MSVREAENAAEEVLKSWWWTDLERRVPLPIEPEEIAESLGIDVVRAFLSPDESGNILIPKEGRAMITLNAFDHPNRQRFTCAHEVGHYVRRSGDRRKRQQSFVDYRATLAGLGRDADEIYANQFAAALLMPARLVAEHRDEDTRLLARRFGTSEQAMELRLRNLRLR